MNDVIEKLQIKEGFKGRAVNLPPELSNLLEGWPQARRKSGLDFILVFVKSAAEIRKEAKGAIGSVREDGLVWFAYPKKTSGLVTNIHRDSGWEPVTSQGFAGVRMVSIDDTWSALRFRDKRYSKRKS